MAAISELPLFTAEYSSAEALNLPEGGSYVYSVTDEPRSAAAEAIAARATRTSFVRIGELSATSFSTDHPEHETVAVRQRTSLAAFAASLPQPVHLDMTGLGHSTWAPLVRVCVEAGIRLNVVYFEPAVYNASAHPEVGVFHDLSERIEGIRPIPMFAKLADRGRQEECFVPLLGFEGARFKYMLNVVDPARNKVFPIAGAPGFLPHYPLDTIALNADGLEQDKAIRNLAYAKSNCPFSLYYELDLIASRLPNDLIRVGLVGTKPHALGAVIFCTVNDERTELIYDHARRKPGRTSGTDKCLVYAVSDFLEK
jgi:hypothetical protein